jgi:hypothetical protein
LKSTVTFVGRTIVAFALGMWVISLWRVYWHLVWRFENVLTDWLVWPWIGRTVLESLPLGPIVNVVPFLAAGAVTGLAFNKLRSVYVGIVLATWSFFLGDGHVVWMRRFGLTYWDCLVCQASWRAVLLSVIVVFGATAAGYKIIQQMTRTEKHILLILLVLVCGYILLTNPLSLLGDLPRLAWYIEHVHQL